MTMQAMPIPKNGSCPSGYHSDGNMSVPNANAKPVIPKNGSCPSGWHSDGNYCVANSEPEKRLAQEWLLPFGLPLGRQLLRPELSERPSRLIRRCSSTGAAREGC
ncbi:hypothetical protein AB3X91_17420 [Paraburkholderia sp. BR14263]|uniref:hypothetical protein n=1 Tax=unclassified Paraburkholderia TaxID=2615204 RepID=UPI0034CE012F